MRRLLEETDFLGAIFPLSCYTPVAVLTRFGVRSSLLSPLGVDLLARTPESLGFDLVLFFITLFALR